MKQNISFILLLLFICCCLAGTIYPPTNKVKVYRALLTQSGTAAPVVTVLENTLGGVVVWTRASAGNYNGTLSSAFTVNKCFIRISEGTTSDGPANGVFAGAARSDANSIAVTINPAGDDQLVETALEILVYP